MGDISLFDLLNALKTVLKKTGNSEALMEVTAEQISVKDRITWILDMLKTKKSLTFDSLFTDMCRIRLRLSAPFLRCLN